MSLTSAWLPQKFMARKTGVGTFGALGAISIKSIRGASPEPNEIVTSFNVALPSKKFLSINVVSNRIVDGFGGNAPYM